MLLENPENELLYGAVTLWEIATKHAKHPEAFPFDAAIVEEYARETGMHDLQMKRTHALSTPALARRADAPPHKDPFDRMLICQAKAEGIFLVTHDGLLDGYGEACVLSV